MQSTLLARSQHHNAFNTKRAYKHSLQRLTPGNRTSGHCPQHRHTTHRICATLGSDSNSDDLDEERARLTRFMQVSSITGTELRELLLEKFNREYDARLVRRGRKTYFQVFWKYLGQRSFPLTEEEYQMQLDAVAEYLTLWGCADTVRNGIRAAKWAPGMTIGGGAKAFSIPLGVDVGEAGRSQEFMI